MELSQCGIFERTAVDAGRTSSPPPSGPQQRVSAQESERGGCGRVSMTDTCASSRRVLARPQREKIIVIVIRDDHCLSLLPPARCLVRPALCRTRRPVAAPSSPLRRIDHVGGRPHHAPPSPHLRPWPWCPSRPRLGGSPQCTAATGAWPIPSTAAVATAMAAVATAMAAGLAVCPAGWVPSPARAGSWGGYRRCCSAGREETQAARPASRSVSAAPR